MAIRPIVMFPDPRLREVAQPVTVFDEGLARLSADLIDTLRAVSGIGITAPHIGVPKRLVVLDPGDIDDARIYVNPIIAWSSAETLRHQEGSVSMPGVTDEIERHARVRITYQDLTGDPRTEPAGGLLAVCHQHEIDQLDGIFWIQRLSRLKRERLVRRFGKQRSGG